PTAPPPPSGAARGGRPARPARSWGPAAASTIAEVLGPPRRTPSRREAEHRGNELAQRHRLGQHHGTSSPQRTGGRALQVTGQEQDAPGELPVAPAERPVERPARRGRHVRVADHRPRPAPRETRPPPPR